MATERPRRPTNAELAILRALWRLGPSTVRQVCELLAQTRPSGYTTVLKTLQIMTAKGLVTRDLRQRTHVYTARHTEGQMQQRLVRDLLDRAFGGSPGRLVMQALSSRRASLEELAEIRRLLDQLERKSP
ncbi:MAG TPA: BlaI/MecI/CopY family transcriptional regulator [Phycisphaerae bacterium]|jgi:predicted transcriptional regulator